MSTPGRCEPFPFERQSIGNQEAIKRQSRDTQARCHLVRCEPFPFEGWARSICGEKRLEDFRGCGELGHAPRSHLVSDSPQLPLSSIELDLVTNLGSAQLSAIDLRIDQRHERLSKPNGAEQLSRAPDEGGNQRSSEVIRGHQRSSGVIRCHQVSSGVIRCHQKARSSSRVQLMRKTHHQRPSDVIRGTHQMLIRGHSEALTRCSSEVLRGEQRPSEAIRGTHPMLAK